jgi:hypothetical protein
MSQCFFYIFLYFNDIRFRISVDIDEFKATLNDIELNFNAYNPYLGKSFLDCLQKTVTKQESIFKNSKSGERLKIDFPTLSDFVILKTEHKIFLKILFQKSPASISQTEKIVKDPAFWKWLK